MMDWDKFFDMGGYAAFVWPAFGLSALVLIVLFIVSLRFLKAQQRALQLLEPSETEQHHEA